MKRFYLRRHCDVSGISGIGNVLEGCLFDNGKVAITWLSDKPFVTIADNINEVIEVHGHEGKTTLIWIDEESSEVIVKQNAVIQTENFRQLVNHI